MRIESMPSAAIASRRPGAIGPHELTQQDAEAREAEKESGAQRNENSSKTVQKMAKPQKGKGTHTFSDGTYTGEWRRGKRHGQGTMAYTSGDRSVRHAGGCAGG